MILVVFARCLKILSISLDVLIHHTSDGNGRPLPIYNNGCPPIASDTLASCLTKEWLDTGTVSPEKYPTSLHAVIHFQSEIGWHHVFAAHVSLRWFTDQDIHSSSLSPLVLGGYFVEFFLTSYISLWEQRNFLRSKQSINSRW